MSFPAIKSTTRENLHLETHCFNVLVYNALIQRFFYYFCEVFDTFGKGLSERLQKSQNRAPRLIMNLKNEHGQSVLARNTILVGNH